MGNKRNRTRAQRLRWWWDKKFTGLWQVKLKGAANRAFVKQSAEVDFTRKPTDSPSSREGITVILNAYKRTEYLADQVDALRKQTVKPIEIWAWCNQSDNPLYDVSHLVDRVVVSNTNWLFWGRFALGNMVRTPYIAFFDDDILPQPRWFESCLDTLKTHGDAILGGSGVLLPLDGGYSTKQKIGWNGRQLNTAEPVDLVGHSWFFAKKNLQYMWREEPKSWDNGEDIHLSYMALKYGNIETLVPPHPEHQRDLWSCRPDFGQLVGKLNDATHKGVDHGATRSKIVDCFRSDGWKLVRDRYSQRDAQ